MNRRVLLDTGPLVALLNGRDKHHGWAKLQWSQTAPPFLTCEPVLSEACFLLRAMPGGNEAIMELLRRHVIEVTFHLEDHLETVARLIRKYSSVPMSLAEWVPCPHGGAFCGKQDSDTRRRFSTLPQKWAAGRASDHAIGIMIGLQEARHH